MSDEYNAASPRPLAVRVLALASVTLAAALAMTAVPALRHWRERPPAAPEPVRAAWIAPVDLSVSAGPDFPFGLALNPDGRRVAFPAAREGHGQLWLQDLRTGAVEALPGTEGAALPFWSPDGTRLGFFAGGFVRAFDIGSARVTDLTPVEPARGAAWNRGGDLVVADAAQSGLALRGVDGTTRTLTKVDKAAGETAHLFPAFLPDGRHVVFFVRAESAARQGIWIVSLDDDSRRDRIVFSAAQAIAGAGHLIFDNDGALVAQPLDVAARRLQGRATVLGVSIGVGPLGQVLATASDETVIYSPPVSALRQLTWVSRTGEPLGSLGSPADIWHARIAPDGRRVVATVLEPLLRTLDVVLFDGTSLMPARVSLSIDADETPVWSPDGLRVAWISAGRAVTVRGAGAVLPAEMIARFDEPVRLTDWTPDGAALVMSRASAPTREDLWVVPVKGGGKPRPLVATPFADVQGAISPDGEWIAYSSDESGRFEVYVESVRDRSPGPGTRERVTSGGGSDPRWSRDGRDLFFRRGSEIHVATPALGRGQNAAAATSMLFKTPAEPRTFDVSPDGRKFLLNLPAPPGAAPPATLVVHWR